ncbi:hypothetical protein EXN61_21930 [Agrobacterium tumefaciens]|uniref:Uncharacterized protein n=1 Tax=Agrobacterium tumefaciens TaxID=358 RepID=A0A546XRZ0_AGRTU|nr:hypothetical protein [Agrobacterium tumefaciens]TRB03518.1 hypothetical protein EXN61_21930 [Agrobacterium tumefaciens]
MMHAGAWLGNTHFKHFTDFMHLALTEAHIGPYDGGTKRKEFAMSLPCLLALYLGTSLVSCVLIFVALAIWESSDRD